MQERAQQIGAQVNVRSSTGQGTLVTLRVPRVKQITTRAAANAFQLIQP